MRRKLSNEIKSRLIEENENKSTQLRLQLNDLEIKIKEANLIIAELNRARNKEENQDLGKINNLSIGDMAASQLNEDLSIKRRN